jgi:hypothetical protein
MVSSGTVPHAAVRAKIQIHRRISISPSLSGSSL